MKPTDTPRTPDAATESPEVRRVSLQIGAQLAQRGIGTHDDDAPAEQADMLTAVEGFEAAVRDRGGDSFTNSLRSSEPERRDFVLPRRGDDERARDYIARVRAATEALGAPPR